MGGLYSFPSACFRIVCAAARSTPPARALPLCASSRARCLFMDAELLARSPALDDVVGARVPPPVRTCSQDHRVGVERGAADGELAILAGRMRAACHGTGRRATKQASNMKLSLSSMTSKKIWSWPTHCKDAAAGSLRLHGLAQRCHLHRRCHGRPWWPRTLRRDLQVLAWDDVLRAQHAASCSWCRARPIIGGAEDSGMGT